MNTQIDWATVDTEYAAGCGWCLDATQFIPAGAHYDTGIAVLGALGQIVGRDARGPYRLIEVNHA